ncbi:MAG TPA: LUD domain-containing protein [Burkholderiaceae bacterium]|nr:LUD domain-containing protein [Burkholderiaceae bacterium]
MNPLNARDLMLGRLRAAAPAAAQLHADELDQRIRAHYERRRAEQTPAERVAAMQAALTVAHADVWCATSAEWPGQLASRLAEHGVRRLLLDPAAAEGAALKSALPPAMEALSFARPLEQWKAELFDSVDAGFTVARSGIAATGTLVLAPDAGTPRTVSLVPPLHVALVYADTLHTDLQAAAQAERWGDGMPTNLVLASSPSKTSDIQQTLAYGAHGPRWMWVIIVTDRPAQGETR